MTASQPLAVRVSSAVAPVVLCRRCKREFLPERPANALKGLVLRAPADGMVKESKPDPRAEKIRRRKERKRSLRSISREVGFLGLVKLVLDASTLGAPMPVQEDCPDCLRILHRQAVA